MCVKQGGGPREGGWNYTHKYNIDMYLSFYRSCSGLIVTSYIKDDKNMRMFDRKLKNLFDQYKVFKKNLDLQFPLSDRQELNG